MTIDALLKDLADAFGPKILKAVRHSARRAYVDIDPKDLRELVTYLFKDRGFRFHIASAVDDLHHMEILYHFCLDSAAIIVSLRAVLGDRHNPRIHTITTITRSAWWIEREIHELFGIHFEGNEDLRPLLLPEDWPKGVYPMRKSYVPPKRDSRKA